jgi:hypothetical protein
MCPARVRQSFAESGVAAAASDDSGRRRFGSPLIHAAVAAWLLYAAVYALTFGLSGSPIWFAISAAVANALPDAFGAVVAIRTSRRADRRRATVGSLVRLHSGLASVVVILAAAAKSLFIWFDVVVVHGQTFQFNPGVVVWHLFLSALTYAAVASVSHAWLIARWLQDEEAHVARAETLRAQAELAALRAQLNPHFLFNTLHSVLGLVRRDPAMAETALEKLGDLLHYAIRVHRDAVDWTSLRREWQFTRTYLDLESIRLGDRLQVDQRVDDAALDERVPTFSIQPLIENAVRHGIAPRAAGGRISIDARLDHEHVSVEVSNDTNRGDVGSPKLESDDGGLGLRVLRERLETLYRGSARMTAGLRADGRYGVVLTLPLRNGDTEAGG